MKTLLLLLLFLPQLACAEHKKAISTCGLTSRLGDRLVDYAHMKWISYKWNIPLLYEPFPYSDELVLDDVEERLSKDSFAAHIKIRDIAQLEHEIDKDTLYILSHFPDSYDEYLFLKWKSKGPYISVDWNDKTFLEMMRALIKPKKPLELVSPKKGLLSLAIHYRTGVDYDSPRIRKWRAMAFPPSEYYVEQIETLWALINHQPLYVYIFTDHPDPSSLKQMFEEKFTGRPIQFDCRISGNRHDANVLEDFFSMMQFDCIIRPVSHYSGIAAHLAHFKIDISPKHVYWNRENNKLVVDEVHIKQSEPNQ